MRKGSSDNRNDMLVTLLTHFVTGSGIFPMLVGREVMRHLKIYRRRSVLTSLVNEEDTSPGHGSRGCIFQRVDFEDHPHGVAERHSFVRN